MRFRFLLILLAVFLFTACSKEQFSHRIEGTYQGNFQRIYAGAGSPVSSNVTLYFSNGAFSGTSGISRYPALCSGTYSIKTGTILLKNSCPFTADFDWSLILNGEYSYEATGSKLRIWRHYPNGNRDVYYLEKRGE